MRQLAILFLFISIISTTLKSQIPTQDSAFTVVTIAPAQSFYLDSRLMSNLNGRSRLTIPVNLPEGTVRWYYSFAASESKNEPLEWVSLAGQLTKLYDRTGIASEAINRLVKPTGTTVCDIFVLNTEGVLQFENKDDANLIVDKDFSRQNMTSGIVEVWVKNKRPVLGLSNPSIKTGINVKIEISAVVSKSKPSNPIFLKETTWNKAQKEDLWAKMSYAFDGKKNNQTDAVTLCAIDSFVHNYTVQEYALMTESEKNYKLTSKIETCFTASGNQNLGIEMGEVAALKMQRDTLEQAGYFAEMLRVSKKIMDLGYPSLSNRFKLARAYILNGKSNEAIEILNPMLRSMPDDWAINLNLANAYLFNNQHDRAEKIFLKFKDKSNVTANDVGQEGVSWEQIVSADFKFFIQNKIFNSRFDNIKKKLKIKD